MFRIELFKKEINRLDKSLRIKDMSSRLNTIFKFTLLLLLGSLVACNEAIPNRRTISGGQIVTPPPGCAPGEHEESEVDEETQEEIKICVKDPIVRPSGAVLFKEDFCGCNNGKAITYGNCSTFCAERGTSGVDTFFANFNVTADIALSGLGSVDGWCNKLLNAGTDAADSVNPKCQLEAKTEDGSVIMVDVTTPSNSNSITANIGDLAKDKTYVLTLVETVSRARSNSIQIIKFSTDVAIPVVGPLKQAPISQYSCVVREFENNDAGDTYYLSMSRMHFYFLPRIPPTPIPAGVTNLICHDIFNPLYGLVDDELFPRLELIPGAFNLWDNTDPRFYDNNGNTIMDVNDVIIQKTKNFGGSLPSGVNFFAPFSWPGSPQVNATAGNQNSTQPIGYFMAPWIDQTTFKSYCLTSTHYNSSNALFKAMRDVIEVDTEGLYVGEKQPETTTTTSTPGSTTSAVVGAKDYVLLRESDLKQVWFYLNNGVPTAPTEDNVANVAVYFYYPLNRTSPYIKSSTQRIFRIRGAAELNAGNSSSSSSSGSSNGSTSSSSTNSSGAVTSYPPHDRKIGCIPKF
jgi:hypothetical protein